MQDGRFSLGSWIPGHLCRRGRTKPAEHPQIRFLKADRQIRQDTVPGLSVGLRGLDDITAI